MGKNPPQRRMTQADVARLAGVSQATVSHVIASMESGRSRVSETMQAKVMEAIRITGYVVNPIAQRLAGGKSGFIGVFTYEPIFSGQTTSFFFPFLVGVERAAEAAGWNLLLYTGAPVSGGQRRLLADGGVRSLGVADGCILLGLHYDEQDLNALLAEGFPFVFIGARHSDAGTVPFVAPDYSSATREVLDLLFAFGHNRIGYVGDLNPDQINRDRLSTYRQVVAGVDKAPGVFIDAATEEDSILEQILDNRLTSVVTDNSGVASRIHRAATARGILVPEQLSIAQLGDSEIEDGIDWSGFTIPRNELGFEAVRLLNELIDGTVDEADQHRMLPCAVTEGATAGPAPIVEAQPEDASTDSNAASRKRTDK